MSTITAAVWLLFVPIVLLIGIALWLSESRATRISRLRRQCQTWAVIAARYGVSQSTARRWAA